MNINLKMLIMKKNYNKGNKKVAMFLINKIKINKFKRNNKLMIQIILKVELFNNKKNKILILNLLFKMKKIKILQKVVQFLIILNKV